FMNKALKNILILILFLLTLIFIFTSLHVPLSQDEGVFLSISRAVSNGHLPYIDYFDHKPPLIYLLLILPLKLINSNFIFYRLLALFINLLTSFFVFKIAENYKKNIGLLAAVSYLFLVYIFEGYYLISEPFLALFLSASFYLIIKSKNNYNFILSGILASFAVLTKQPAFISVLALVFIAYRNNKKLENFMYFILGVISPLIFLSIYLVFSGMLDIFIEQVLTSNFYYPAMPITLVLLKSLNLIYQSWYFWIFVIYFAFVVKQKDKILLLLMLLLPTMTYLVRDYAHYWIQSMPFVAVCFSLGSDYFAAKYKKLSVAILVVFLLTSIPTVKWFFWMYINTWKAQSVEQQEATEYVKFLDGDYIFAENRFTPFYFSSSKKNISRFLYITEITDHYGASQDVISKLDMKDKLIVLWPNDGIVYSRGIENKIKDKFNKVKSYDKLNMDVYINY
ncbi:hypothetical protein HGB13_04710, partial [bacterium]|nr:hypothetical protein [bacterium]